MRISRLGREVEKLERLIAAYDKASGAVGAADDAMGNAGDFRFHVDVVDLDARALFVLSPSVYSFAEIDTAFRKQKAVIKVELAEHRRLLRSKRKSDPFGLNSSTGVRSAFARHHKMIAGVRRRHGFAAKLTAERRASEAMWKSFRRVADASVRSLEDGEAVMRCAVAASTPRRFNLTSQRGWHV